MVDISSIKRYIAPVDDFGERFCNQQIRNYTHKGFLDRLLKELDSTVVWDNGMRPMQTISYVYRSAIGQFLYTLNSSPVEESEKDDYLIKLLTRHNQNLEYEVLNPPIDYGGKVNVKSTVKTKTSKPKVPKEPKEKGPTAAERKLAAKAAKLNSLSIKIKPV